MRRTLLALIFLLATGGPAASQQRTLLPGDEVRVVAPDFHRGPVRGQVVRYLADTLAVREAATDSVFAIPMHAIRGLARNEGPMPRRAVRRGGMMGAFIGGALGVVLGPFVAASGDDDSGFVATTALSGAVGVALGGGLGAASGALFSGDHWQHYSMARRDACDGQPCARAPLPVQATQH